MSSKLKWTCNESLMYNVKMKCFARIEIEIDCTLVDVMPDEACIHPIEETMGLNNNLS